MNILDHAKGNITYQIFIMSLNNYSCTQHNYIKNERGGLQEGTLHLHHATENGLFYVGFRCVDSEVFIFCK